MTSEEKRNDDSSSPSIQSAPCSSDSVGIITSSPSKVEAAQECAQALNNTDCSTMSQDEKQKQHELVDGQQNDSSIDDIQKNVGTSKRAMKRQLKIEKVKEYRKKKKEMEKEIKRSKAIAAGRNLEEERKKLEERARLGGEGRMNRENMWNEKFKNINASFGVCIDCAYEDLMTEKEIKSLAQQIRYCYAQNKQSSHPCRFVVSNLGGKTLENLKKESGFPDHWKARGFDCSEKSLTETFPTNTSQLVYLTSDSDNILDQLCDETVYVIGGIVDRNRLKRAAITRAESLGLKTAKLPIDQHVKLSATKVLTCNHVFQILLKYREHGNIWKEALMEALPQRKNIQEIKNGNDCCGESNDD
jgi:tRNA (guanine9-N1)-methyltransferase